LFTQKVGCTYSKRVIRYPNDLSADYDHTKVSIHKHGSTIIYWNDQIYLIHAKPEDYFIRKNGRGFDRQDYYTNPNEWESVFGDRVRHLVVVYVSFDILYTDHAVCDSSHQRYRVVVWLPSFAFH